MCKLFAATSLTPMDWPKVRAAVFAAMEQTEKDGLGAAWSTAEPFKFGRVRASDLHALNGNLMPFCEGFAKVEDLPFDGGPVICHGRTSTNFVGLDNTHPFVMRDKGRVLALAHNGVVTSEKYSTRAGGCDSELILEAFASGGMAEVAKQIEGYYALLILEKTKAETLLHVIRDDCAQLYCGRIGEAWAFATTEHLLKCGGATPVSRFKGRMHATFSGNKLIRCKPFTQPPRKYATGAKGYVLSAAAKKAFRGQQGLLEIEAEEEARLQASLEAAEARAEAAAARPDFPLDDRGDAHDWPAHSGRGSYRNGD